MSFRNIDETRERERLEKLFRSSSETTNLVRNNQVITRESSGRLQPYLIGAALSMFLIGFACVLQEPQREAPLEKPFQSVQTPPISGQLHPSPAAHFDIAASKAGLTGIVDSRTLTASYYWTVVLKNRSSFTQEALATLKLPDGAVVSRATEWINGIPQEAAFNTVASTNNAYNNLTSRGRDPLIVNAVGNNSVEIKAFPINPNGGIVKIRLGITAPMKVNAEGKASVAAPYLVSSNFDANSSEEFHIQSRSHLLAVTGAENGAATRNVASKELSGISKDNENYVLSAHVNQDELKNLTIETNSNASESEFAVRATHSPKDHFIRFSLKPSTDGSTNIPQLIRTTNKPDVKIIADEDASFRLSNLWAAQEVDRLQASGRTALAEKVGTVFRLVTPVTSAVVLETNQDYGRFNLHRERYSVIAEQGSQGNVASSEGLSREVPQADSAAPALQGATPMLVGATTTMQAAAATQTLQGATPILQGATNGSIGPQGTDATFITGVNTAGTVVVVPQITPLQMMRNAAFATGFLILLVLSATKLGLTRLLWRKGN